MEDKKVVLIRKQDTEYKINYPYASQSNIPREYIWMGTKGKILNEKPVPFEVFEWLRTKTSVFENGCLIIKETDDEVINDIKDNMANIDDAEQSILTKDEIIEILTTGNHLSLKKKLNELTDGKTNALQETIKRQVTNIAQEEGVDSSAKRKALCEWLGVDYENSDLLFDKNFEEMLEKKSK